MSKTQNRTPDMDCLLCKVNKATKTNSHIVPRFIGKSMLGKQNQKEGFTLSTEKPNDRPDKTQDTPKEDFILCPSCEKYFSVLETHFSDKVYNRLWDAKYSNEFAEFHNDELKLKACNNLDPITFHLFIYSIYWRCSISSNKYFETFKLELDEEEELRAILMKYKHETYIELQASIKNALTKFPFHRYVLTTSEGFENETDNFYWAIPFKIDNFYWLILNQFSFQLFFNSNTDIAYLINILLFKPEVWHKVIRMPFMEIYYKELLKIEKETGIKPWILRKENKGNF